MSQTCQLPLYGPGVLLMGNQVRRFAKQGCSVLHYGFWLCLNFIISISLTRMTSYSQYMKASWNVKSNAACCYLRVWGKQGLGSHCTVGISAAITDNQHHGGMLWGCAVHYYVRQAFSFKCTAIGMNLNKTLKGISCRKLMSGEPILNKTCSNPLFEKQ